MNVKAKLLVLETASVSTPMVHTHVYVMKGISMYKLRVSTSVKVRISDVSFRLHTANYYFVCNLYSNTRDIGMYYYRYSTKNIVHTIIMDPLQTVYKKFPL